MMFVSQVIVFVMDFVKGPDARLELGTYEEEAQCLILWKLWHRLSNHNQISQISSGWATALVDVSGGRSLSLQHGVICMSRCLSNQSAQTWNEWRSRDCYHNCSNFKQFSKQQSCSSLALLSPRYVWRTCRGECQLLA